MFIIFLKNISSFSCLYFKKTFNLHHKVSAKVQQQQNKVGIKTAK